MAALSLAPVISRRLSGEKAMVLTMLPWPLSKLTSLPVEKSYSRAMWPGSPGILIQPPVASQRAFGDSAMP